MYRGGRLTIDKADLTPAQYGAEEVHVDQTLQYKDSCDYMCDARTKFTYCLYYTTCAG